MSIDPEKPLYEACRKMLKSRARRIPLISLDSQTGRTMVTSVITQYRILKFVAVNVGDTAKLRKPLRTLKLGTFTNLCTASMDTSVIEVIHEMVKRSISSVPIVTSQSNATIAIAREEFSLTYISDILLNVFEAVDVIGLIKGGDYEALQLSVGEALCKRPNVRRLPSWTEMPTSANYLPYRITQASTPAPWKTVSTPSSILSANPASTG